MSPGPSTTTGQTGSAAIRSDLIAGLTAAAVVLPKAMAYATVAGLPVAVGLYTAFVPMLIYALLGSSRALSVSTTTTLAILAGTQLGIAVPDGDPTKAGPGVGDIFPAALGAVGILAAAHNAAQTGEGQYVDVAMYDGVLSLCERIVYQYSYTGERIGWVLP